MELAGEILARKCVEIQDLRKNTVLLVYYWLKADVCFLQVACTMKLNQTKVDLGFYLYGRVLQSVPNT
eukprot:c36777_g1_i1 orf=433-636(+)